MKPENDLENPTPIDLLLYEQNEYDTIVGEQREKSFEIACNELIDAIQSVQDWNGTYVGECIEKLKIFFLPNSSSDAALSSKNNKTYKSGVTVTYSASLVGRHVKWTADLRPMPGQLPGDDLAESPCWDTSLIQQRTGTIVAISRTIFGSWKCLIETDGKFHSGPIELDVRELRIYKEEQ